MLLRFYRKRRRTLVGIVAAMPLLQTAGCGNFDPVSLLLGFGSSFGSSVAQQVVLGFAQNFTSFVLQTFPGSNLLRALFGGNAGLFP